MNRFSILTFVMLGSLLGTPAFAAPQTGVERQAAQLHAALDAYEAANETLVMNLEANADLPERTRSFLMSLTQQEKSSLLTLRAKLWNAKDAKGLRSVVSETKAARAAMKQREDTILQPILDLATLNATLLPTAEARLATLENAVTKKQYDQFAASLHSIQKQASALQVALLGKQPPADARGQVRKLQESLKQFYASIRKVVR